LIKNTIIFLNYSYYTKYLSTYLHRYRYTSFIVYFKIQTESIIISIFSNHIIIIPNTPDIMIFSYGLQLIIILLYRADRAISSECMSRWVGDDRTIKRVSRWQRFTIEQVLSVYSWAGAVWIKRMSAEVPVCRKAMISRETARRLCIIYCINISRAMELRTKIIYFATCLFFYVKC